MDSHVSPALFICDFHQRWDIISFMPCPAAVRRVEKMGQRWPIVVGKLGGHPMTVQRSGVGE